MKLLLVCILLYYIDNLIGQPVPLQQRLKVLCKSETSRTRRQAGYVYNKPSVAFDLPTRAPNLVVTSQAPTVDRTQAQMMFYAYPVPAAAGNAVSTGASSGASNSISGGSTATASASARTSEGYNYRAQKGGERVQAGQAAGPSQSSSAQSSGAGSTGYGYNAPSSASANTGSIQQSTGAAVSGYGFNGPSIANAPGGSVQQSTSSGSSGYGNNNPSVGNAPTGPVQQSTSAGASGYGYSALSVGTNQQTTNVQPTQSSNAVSSQSGSISGSGAGYDYNTPAQQHDLAPKSDISTGAPKYLPPTSGSGSSNDISSGAVVLNGGDRPDNDSGVSSVVIQPLDQYLPPVVSNPNSPPAPVVDQYLPPNLQLNSPPAAVSSGPSIVNGQNNSGTSPNTRYIPPSPGQSPLPVANVTPRPFSPAPLSDGYLPPTPNSPSTPASPYLPPVL